MFRFRETFNHDSVKTLHSLLNQKATQRGEEMLKAPKNSTRSWTLMPLTGVCLAIALITSGSPPAADRDGDRDDGGGRRCGPVSKAGTDPSGFPLPEVRRSHDGVLRTTLHACISTKEMLDENAQPPTTVKLHPPTFEGTIPGPTLEVKPGDRLSILLVNDLPFNPPNERRGAFPHDEYTLNLHTHGLTVSPLRMSDNIFREMRPGTANLIEIDLPKDHPSGTYWYHVHKHGSVTYQFLGGMAGFLIVKGGEGTLDTVPEVAAAKDVPMAFQIIRSTHDGKVVFVHEQAEQFGTFPFPDDKPPPTTAQQGLWSTYGLDGGPTVAPDGSFTGPKSRFSYTTNGVANPTLHMRPGEVQRWRLLNATDGDNLQLVLVSNKAEEQGLGLNIVAMDAITVPKTYRLNTRDPLVIGPAQRYDVMVKAGQPGTYLLQTLDPNSGKVKTSVSPYRDAQFPNGIDPATRVSRHSNDFPVPCPGLGMQSKTCDPAKQFSYPVALATIEVSGKPKEMDLPADPLPTPTGLPSIATMLSRTPDAVRNVVFEDCGNVNPFGQFVNLPSCGWYFAKYKAAYWGGALFLDLLMMRDAEDVGKPSPSDPNIRINFKKEGLFDATKPLFPDMIAGNYEEWTVYNHSFSDHPFHLHQNHVLITKINGITLPQSEWHDTFDVPAVVCPDNPATCTNPVIIKSLAPGSITFRTYFNPVTVGCFVAHCHTLDHEDIGMMQRMDILPAPGQPSGCSLDQASAAPLIEKFIASRSSFQICSAAPRQSRSISYRPTPPAN
jgi:FtsP/CotA-like multicopper oxidase with cupredoxin domain